MDYSDYSKSTQQYMKSVEKFIRQKYGKVSNEWSLSLQQMAQLKQICEECFDNIRQNGISTENRYGGLVTNPSVNQYNISLKTLLQLQKEFGLTPSAMKKIEKLSDTDTTEETEEEMALSLIA